MSKDKKVVFPAPEGPRIAVTRPGSIEPETEAKIVLEVGGGSVRPKSEKLTRRRRPALASRKERARTADAAAWERRLEDESVVVEEEEEEARVIALKRGLEKVEAGTRVRRGESASANAGGRLVRVEEEEVGGAAERDATDAPKGPSLPKSPAATSSRIAATTRLRRRMMRLAFSAAIVEAGAENIDDFAGDINSAWGREPEAFMLLTLWS
jgi:hypothetical protein